MDFKYIKDRYKVPAEMNREVSKLTEQNKYLIDGLKLLRNRIKLAPKGILPESKFIIEQLLERYNQTQAGGGF
jgi:hypothetical protein